MKPSNPTLAELLAYQACLEGYSVRFTIAIDAVNTFLLAFQAAGRLKAELNKYLKPRVLALDEQSRALSAIPDR
jgi:hypothetical protein